MHISLFKGFVCTMMDHKEAAVFPQFPATSGQVKSLFSARWLVVLSHAHICITDFGAQSARPTSQRQSIKLAKEKPGARCSFPTGDKNTSPLKKLS